MDVVHTHGDDHICTVLEQVSSENCPGMLVTNASPIVRDPYSVK